MKKIGVIHGPNLNMLGIREPEIYGTININSLNKEIKNIASILDLEVKIIQSNYEGEIIDFLQNNYKDLDGIIINPCGLTHTSISLRDTLSGIDIPTIEVHISNIHRREEFRKKSYTAEVSIGQITGLGVQGYFLALKGLKNILKNT